MIYFHPMKDNNRRIPCLRAGNAGTTACSTKNKIDNT